MFEYVLELWLFYLGEMVFSLVPKAILISARRRG
jgi:hypothetical protein